ncbi:proline-rich nuclear receptor coactivator 1 [Colossoma macropomum]|uniref:proline-rich nuclear receptor coactivator 1 n=1 Tax=Colossoma macropomum TaxID=42526 RepID=UPI001864A852|nr:proline-rich nuclear receptor coactivator 1 [Colossoma macropomum]
MYPPLPPCGGVEIMLGEALGRRIESSLDDVENNKPPSGVVMTSSARSNLNASRRALLKKGARRVRTATSLQSKHGQSQGQQQHYHHQRQLRSNNNQVRLADINNNNSSNAASRTAAPATELPANRAAGNAGTHLKTGAKKELLKSKTGKVERGNQSNGQSIHSPSKHEQSTSNLNARSQKNRLNNTTGSITLAKKCESSNQQSPPLFLIASRREGKRPLSSVEASRNANVYPAQPSPEESLKDGEKTYAGAKFSEPPSPSVLPKPPSHWVGENGPKHSDSSREQMSVHLKTLLKVQAKP